MLADLKDKAVSKKAEAESLLEEAKKKADDGGQ